MMVNMLVKIWLYLTKAVITGDVDEVRVQSEEPYLRSRCGKLKRAFFLFHSHDGGNAGAQEHSLRTIRA
jgi:hypothetical protein